MKFKKTKIIATISDKNCSDELLKKLYNSGMNIVRLNTAHQTPEITMGIINQVRSLSMDIQLIVDTKGPEVRTKDITNTIEVKEGDLLYIGEAPDDLKSFNVNYDNFIREVPEGANVLIDDGSVIMKVTEKKEKYLCCRIENKGVIENRKSVNVPEVHLNIPPLSEKDRQYIDFAVKNDIDFIAHSFVRNKNDVAAIQTILDKAGSKVKIIAKIENREGVDNIDEILDVVYGVMIARGDLGVETPGEDVPIFQKKIIDICRRRAIPVIVATQMLHTMIDNPTPTRAEISDVANAVYDGADAVMLSGETAYGKYPLESVITMAKIAARVEQAKPEIKELPTFQDKNLFRNFLAKSTVKATQELPIEAIIIDTNTGYSARTVSAYRGRVPIYANCHNMRTVRELMLSYGIYSSYSPMPETTDELVTNTLHTLLEKKKIAENDIVAILAGVPGHEEGSDFLEINAVNLCLEGRKK